jgi:adenosylcobinamide-GDP ribazoletransferase
MRDEQVGAFGLACGFLLLALKYASLLELPDPASALILIPTLSRWGMALALFFYPYARDQGLGREIKDHTTWRQFLLATLIAVMAAWSAAGWMGLLATALAALGVWLSASFILARIPGLTGDTYGAINELIEVGLLVLAAGMNLLTG